MKGDISIYFYIDCGMFNHTLNDFQSIMYTPIFLSMFENGLTSPIIDHFMWSFYSEYYHDRICT